MLEKRVAGGVGPYGCEAVGLGANLRDVEDAVPYGIVQISGVVRKPREGQAPPLRDGAKPWVWVQICGTSRTPSPTGGRQAVRFRRRGGRPRPPADMVECRTNGPPGASAPTGVRPWVRVRNCGTSRTPSPTGWCEAVRWVRIRGRLTAAPTAAPGFSRFVYPDSMSENGRGKPLPYGDGRTQVRGRESPHPPQCTHWGTFPSRGRQAGRRGRRPLRDCERPFVSVVGAAALGRPRTWMNVGETGRRGRRTIRV